MYRPSIEGAKYVFQEITIQDAFITGHHAYRVYPNVGEVLTCKVEPENPFDPSAVKVLDSTERIVGHVPATTCPLNKAIFQILEKWPGFPLEWYCNIYNCCYIVTFIQYKLREVHCVYTVSRLSILIVLLGISMYISVN